jgi:predicted nuclease of predicted toxin-antitoxin system
MGGASDSDLWDVAQRGGFILVTKDEDFVTLSVLRGHPPKVVWLNTGNASTDDTLAVLLRQADAICAFAGHADTSFLALALKPPVAQPE